MRKPTAYDVKRIALFPRILAGRRRERDQPALVRTGLDRMMYSRGTYEFIDATIENPDILVDVCLRDDQVALDVGAYHGTWADRVLRRSSGGVVHAFEPSPAELPVLHAAAATEERFVVHDYGLGAADERVRLAAARMGSSVYHHLDSAPSQAAEIRDIDRVWRELGLASVAVMKINIEGGEYPLLDRMRETGLLPRVDTYLIQYHEWFPGSYSRRRHIRRALSRSHTCTWDYPFVWERWDRR